MTPRAQNTKHLA